MFEEDNIWIDSHTSRNSALIFDLNMPFGYQMDESDEYSFQGNFDFVLKEEKCHSGIELATVSGIFFDENKILNEGQDVVDIADMFTSDTYEAIDVLMRSELFQREIDEDKSMTPLFNCYIERVFINPEYRNKGLGNYIFNNLDQIFLHCFNTLIRCFVILPAPQILIGGQWRDADDKDSEMLKVMINTLVKSNFEQLENPKYYGKNCAADYV